MIDGLSFRTWKIVIAALSINDKVSRSQFFKETFLIANINMNIILEISFLTLSNVEIYYLERELNCKLFTTIKVLPTEK